MDIWRAIIETLPSGKMPNKEYERIADAAKFERWEARTIDIFSRL